MSSKKIPFNKPYMTGKEIEYILDAYSNAHLAGDGSFTIKCHDWLETYSGTNKALLSHSCTAALEMSALLLDIQAGDEIIMPSYTFVSTANAFVLRGGTPVFIDIRKDTLNIDESLIEEAITPRTKAIVPVHYAGVSCEMDTILHTAKKHNLFVVEDAAQGLMSSYKGKPLGSIGDLGTISFHETKNIISGEGGALFVNRDDLITPAEIIREKGTDRSRFFRGEVDKYTWQAVGSSFLPGEIIAAFLWAQLEHAKEITQKRLGAWNYYHKNLASLEEKGLIKRPTIPSDCTHNAHMYYVLIENNETRDIVIKKLNDSGYNTVFHYIPLHSSPAGKHHGRSYGSLSNTDALSSRLIRLPLWVDIEKTTQDSIISALQDCLI